MQRLECERMFVAVMEAGSFAKAAERLGTSSGQASKLVSRLERDLGVRLLNRTTRALSPTEVGRAYYERIRLLLEELDALDLAVSSRAGTASGRLRLTAPLSFGNTPACARRSSISRCAIRRSASTSASRTASSISWTRASMPRCASASRTMEPSSSASSASRGSWWWPRLPISRGAARRERPEHLAAHDCIVDTNFRGRETWQFRDWTDRLLDVTVPSRHLSVECRCLRRGGGGGPRHHPVAELRRGRPHQAGPAGAAAHRPSRWRPSRSRPSIRRASTSPSRSGPWSISWPSASGRAGVGPGLVDLFHPNRK